MWILLAAKWDAEGRRVDWYGPGAAPGALELGAPVDAAAVEALRAAGVRIRTCSRWLNAVSGTASVEVLARVRRHPYVHDVVPVRRLRAPSPQAEVEGSAARPALAASDAGLAYQQLAQIGVLALHSRGLTGHGVRVAVLDNGFHCAQHKAMASVRVVASRDFINGDDIVSDEVGQPVTGDETKSSQNIHGAQVLSILAGSDPGRFLGVAPAAEYVLAKTEDNGVEMPVEEDRWVAGLEWADSLGARIISSSLGYNVWDDGTGYSYAELDGATAVCSRAAAAAVARGIVVVVAAGNEGSTAWRHVTAPADAPGVIAVGAVDMPPAGTRLPLVAASSSRGPTADGRVKPDVVAPGQGVVAADIRGTDYVRVSGTSFATPIVAGVCALLLQAHPEWGPSEVLARLRATATDLGDPGPDNDYGWGQVDALAASGLGGAVPDASMALAPYPNPVRGDQVRFPVKLATATRLRLGVFTAAGERVHTEEWPLAPGEYVAVGLVPTWDLRSTEARLGCRLANGCYLYELSCERFHRRGVVALVRGRD